MSDWLLIFLRNPWLRPWCAKQALQTPWKQLRTQKNCLVWSLFFSQIPTFHLPSRTIRKPFFAYFLLDMTHFHPYPWILQFRLLFVIIRVVFGCIFLESFNVYVPCAIINTNRNSTIEFYHPHRMQKKERVAEIYDGAINEDILFLSRTVLRRANGLRLSEKRSLKRFVPFKRITRLIVHP